MTHADTITFYYKWILRDFTVDRRADFVEYLRPHFAAMVHPGDQVLDLCCGAGPFSFCLEEQGAEVTAIDSGSYMIQLAKETAFQRGSTVNFIQADVLTYPLNPEQYDLVLFLGNTLSEFSLDNFIQLSQKANKTLKHGGKFALHYIDGFFQFIYGDYQREEVQQEKPERITRRFKEYLPETFAYIEVYRNETTGDIYEDTSYLYTLPYVHLAMGGLFELEQTICLSERNFLDVFLKR